MARACSSEVGPTLSVWELWGVGVTAGHGQQPGQTATAGARQLWEQKPAQLCGGVLSERGNHRPGCEVLFVPQAVGPRK